MGKRFNQLRYEISNSIKNSPTGLKRGKEMKYNEIVKLHEMLEEENIQHSFEEFLDGYQIRLNNEVDAIEHFGSYGNSEDKIEIMGGLTEQEQQDDSVLGYLTAEEVFKRFKYCCDNKTSTYKAQL